MAEGEFAGRTVYAAWARPDGEVEVAANEVVKEGAVFVILRHRHEAWGWRTKLRKGHGNWTTHAGLSPTPEHALEQFAEIQKAAARHHKVQASLCNKLAFKAETLLARAAKEKEKSC